VHEARGNRARRDDVEADDAIAAVEDDCEELFAVELLKPVSEDVEDVLCGTELPERAVALPAFADDSKLVHGLSHDGHG
jgi:hypothetical protein